VRIALLTEGGYPYARGEAAPWCDRLVRGLGGHDFEVYALSRSARQESAEWRELPDNVERVRTAPLWDGASGRPGSARSAAHAVASRAGGVERTYGRRERRRFAECFGELAAAVCSAGAEGQEGVRGDAAPGGQLADRFAAGLYGLAELARERGGLAAALRSELAVRVLQSACRAPGTLRAAHSAGVSDLLAVAERLERALRPLSLDWYGDGEGCGCGDGCGDGGRNDVHGHGHGHGHRYRHRRGDGERDAGSGDPGLAAADLCHVVGGGPAALPGLLAKRFFGTPLLITEYGVRLREHYLASAADAVAPAAAGAPVRALLASFQRQLAREAYTQAHLITPGNTHARRWQERCGAPRDKLRTVYPGMDAAPFAEIGELAGSRRPRSGAQPDADGSTIVWAGRIEPAKDLIGLLHAFAEIRRTVPGARLRIIATAPGRGPEAGEYERSCRALAAQLFPDEADDAVAVGENPVSFEELGSPAVPTSADAYGAGCVVVLSSLVEGFPLSLVEAMFCGRATVSTDVGAVCEVIGGTGLVVPSRNPRALADSCAALLRDPARRERLGAAARARALELFTVEQNVAAFRGIYLELMSRWPVRRDETAAACDAGGESEGPRPFGRPAESHVPGRWADGANGSAAAAASVSGGRRPGGMRSPVQVLPGVGAVVPSVIAPALSATSAAADRAGQGGDAGADSGASSRRSRVSVPSWARPDLPDSAPVGRRQRQGQHQQVQQSVRNESRKGDSR